MLGNIPQAEEYLSKFQNLHDKFGPNMEKALSPENLSVRATLHAAKGRWAEAINCYEEVLVGQDGKKSNFRQWSTPVLRPGSFCSGRIPEAEKHLLEGQKIMQAVAAKTDHPNII